MFKNENIAGFITPAIIGSHMLYKKYYKYSKQFSKKKNIVLVGYGYAGRTFYNKINKSKYNIKVILGGNMTVLQPYFLDSFETGSNKKVIHKLDNTNINLKIYHTLKSIDKTKKL